MGKNIMGIDVIKKVIQADKKALGVKVKDGIVYKGEIGFGDLPLEYKDEHLFLYLRGMAAVFDNKELWVDVKKREKRIL